jgi:hypothetical protein
MTAETTDFESTSRKRSYLTGWDIMNMAHGSAIAEGGCMAKRAAWILVLLVVLLAVSAGVAFAAGITRSGQAMVQPDQELGTGAKSSVTKFQAIGSGKYGVSEYKEYGRGDCPFDSESAAAY